ncbi:MAG: hypothetical protein HETSPECPRED_002360 [Heterodermia speciosa]|uniref:Uncharacterized protein n=1 Tax=Heterodermia speciosa TaxID=116794 RepID=A0A8H3PHA8_9LECA|nr:MAG: hypothetical protein HETSPECPRED_002360 [Heterodermia speciosa]
MKTFVSATIALIAVVLPLSITASPVSELSTLQTRNFPACCPEAQNAAKINDQTALTNAVKACTARGCAVSSGSSNGSTSTAVPSPVAAAPAADGNGCLTTCGPPSQFYKPGCHCENTLFVKRVGCIANCGPPSQFYKPGCHCENTLFVKRDGCIKNCGPPSQFYKPGCHCENTLFGN